MSVKVSAGEFRGRILRTDQSSVPVEDGDNADWDTGGGVLPLPSMRWEAVTDGEDVFVWEGDDLVHEWKDYA